jgi:VCBS repeat protein
MPQASTAPRPPPARASALAAVALLAALAAGCSRDMEIPPERTFAAAADRASVAPREAVVLTASNGTPPYRWTFADGGRLSGGDATIDAEGAVVGYRAGSAGSAQDVVEVRDANGSSARLSITVTARLSVSPSATILAPGGVVVLQATGGKPPYAFTLQQQGSGDRASLFTHPDQAAADYRAGAVGDTQDLVAVTDSSGTPGVTVVATARVTSALQIFPRAVTAAPNEVLSFTAFGGQPPYAFHGVGGMETLDPAVGLVRVRGASADGTLVEVVDANSQVALAEVTLLPGLTAALSSTDVRGGTPIRVEAAGGKPPYAFAFAARGNRSHATLDPVSGVWTPGHSPGAVDHLLVSDATGTTVAVDPPAVGPLQLTPGTGVMRCVTGDFDGNRVADVAFLHRQMSLTEVTGVGTSSELSRTYHVGTDFSFPSTWIGDPDRNGLDELVFLGSRQGAPEDPGGFGAGLWALLPGLDGTFAKSGALVSGRRGQTGTWVGVLPTISGDADVLLTEQLETGLLLGAAWPVGSAGPSSYAIPVVDWADLVFDPASRVTQLAAAELDGATGGPLDLVLLKGGGDSYDSGGPAHVRYGALVAGSPTYLAELGASAIPFPAGHRFRSAMDGDQRRLVALPPPAPGAPGGLLVRLEETASGRGALFVLHGRPATWTAIPDLLGGAGFDGATLLPDAADGTADVVGWGVDGGYVFFQVGPGFQLAPGTPASPSPLAGQAGFPITAGCSADVSGDGAPDLVLAGTSLSTADVLLGDGDGGFGTRPHLRGASWPAAMGDFDGDGLGDVVASEGGLGLAVLYGDDGQLGWSGRISGGPASLVTAGPFVAGAPGDSVLFRAQAGAFYLVARGATGFAAPQLLPSRRPDGRPITATFIPLAVNAAMGGPDPGPDLLTWESDSAGTVTAHLLWRQGGALVDLPSQPIGPSGAVGLKARDCWFQAVGAEDGRAGWGADEVHAGVAVAALCSFENPADPQRSPNLARALGATVLGDGATLRLSPWSVSAPITGAAGATLRLAPLGTLAGRALYALGGSGLWLVALGGTGAAADPAGWTTIPATPVAYLPFTEWHPFFGALGDLDGDGDSDAVVTTSEQRLLVLRNDGSDAAPAFQPWPGTARGLGGAGLIPLGVRPARWDVRPDPALGTGGLLGLPGVMVFNGDFDNLGLEPEIIPLRNLVRDATGQVLK